MQFCKRLLVHSHAVFLFSLFLPIESKKKSWEFWGNMESILLQPCLVPWSRIQKQTCMNNWSNLPFKVIILAFEGYLSAETSFLFPLENYFLLFSSRCVLRQQFFLFYPEWHLGCTTTLHWYVLIFCYKMFPGILSFAALRFKSSEFARSLNLNNSFWVKNDL